jgi:hypothetical protein
MRTRRLGACLLAATCAALCALPGPFAPSSARAEVRREFERRTAALRDLVERELSPGRERVVVHNGQVLRTRYGRARVSSRELFDRLGAYAAARLAGPIPEGREAAERRDAELARLASQPYRYEGEGWGGFVQLFDVDPGGAPPDLAALARGEALGAAGASGFVAVAFDAPGGAHVYVTYLDPEVRLLDYLGAGEAAGADAPGGDVPGIPRFPGSRRTLALSEYADGSEVHQVGYAGSGSVRSHVRHYTRALERAGLRAAPAITTAEREATLHFDAPGREVSLYVRRDPAGGTVDFLQIRTSEGRGR